MTITLIPHLEPVQSKEEEQGAPFPVSGSGRTTYLSCLTQLEHAVDPLAFLAAGSPHVDTTALFWQPSQGRALVGLGAAYVHETGGPSRFQSLAAALRDFGDALVRTDQHSFPVLAGGAFHDHIDAESDWRDFPAAALVVPSVLLQIDENEVALRITIAIDAETSSGAAEETMRELRARALEWSQAERPVADPSTVISCTGEVDREDWYVAVDRAVQAIQDQQFEKVVLARQAGVEASGAISPVETLSRLCDVNPGATLFAESRGNAWFIGASPERLVKLTGGNVEVSCLAGSIGLGNSEAERQQLAAELLQSKKDRLEHELVVGPIMRALAEVCDDVTRAPGTPRVVPARSVQHLETGISARLRGPGHVLDLVQRLHPTPAVGGFPRDRALSAMRQLEHIERGWYAGPFGWTDVEGNGEFVVALRSALLTGASATVFAGCGIVGDSVPAHEYEESRLKMRPMLAALGAE